MVEMTDRTGEPYPLRDYEDALSALETAMRDPLKMPPMLVVHSTIIRDGLKLVIALYKRKEEADAKVREEGGHGLD